MKTTDELIQIEKDLTVKIDAIPVELRTSRKQKDRAIKREYEKLVHTRYCVDQVLYYCYDIEI